jgi:hypothetical protein
VIQRAHPSPQAAAAGVLIACVVAAAVIPFVSVDASVVSTDAAQAMMAHGLGALEEDAQGAGATSASTRGGYLPELLARMGEQQQEEAEEEGGEEQQAPAAEDEDSAAADAADADGEQEQEGEEPAAAAEEEVTEEAGSVQKDELEPLVTSPWKTSAADVGEAESSGSAAWPTRLVVVPAVYNEWDFPKDANSDASLPEWAKPSVENGDSYSMGPFYQRRFPEQPNYVPNHAYETAVYMKFVIDNYDNLPDTTAFVQADYDVVYDVGAAQVVERS